MCGNLKKKKNNHDDARAGEVLGFAGPWARHNRVVPIHMTVRGGPFQYKQNRDK